MPGEPSNDFDVVTGAASFSGRYITRALLQRGRRVRSLTRRRAESLFGDAVEWHPFHFDQPEALVESLSGADTLYNTYWVRFPRGATSFDTAVQNTEILAGAARRAGVRRIVHLSVSNPSASSPYPYFRGKAESEEVVRGSGMSYAVIRPTLIYAAEDVLINNITWLLRRFPLFLIPGDGRYRLQPVFAEDMAEIAVRAGAREDDLTMDAAGPDIITYSELVQVLRDVVRSPALIVPSPTPLALLAARGLKPLIRDAIVTPQELGALMDELLVSAEPPAGTTHFGDWVRKHSDVLGRTYTSELQRHWRPIR